MIDKKMLVSKLEFAKSMEDSYITILASLLEKEIGENEFPEDVVNLMIETLDYLKKESLQKSELVAGMVEQVKMDSRYVF